MEQRPELDRWIISELNELVADVTAALERYSPQDACIRVESFVGYLSNWYVRRSRRRFWKSEADDDKLAAHSTLYECLVTLTRLLAPFVPFVTESMYGNLARPANGRPESVHLESYPVADEARIDRGLSEATRLAMRLSSLGRAARSKAGIKVRQPLDRALVSLRSESERGALERVRDQVRDELNVKDVAAMEDDGEVVGFHVEAVLSKVGPQLWPPDARRCGGPSGGGPPRRVPYGQRRASGRGGRVHAGAGRGLGDAHGRGGLRLGDGGGLHRRGHDGDQPRARAGGSGPGARARRPEHAALRGVRHRRSHRHVRHRRRRARTSSSPPHGDYIQRETLADAVYRTAVPEGAFSESHKVNGREAVVGLVRR